jgi:transcriptional regulator GlxA family with amidase domain
MREAPAASLPAQFLADPASLAHHLLLTWHGHVKLRVKFLAREIGVDMRSLQRSFALRYRITISEFQQDCRLRYAGWMLSIFPPTKVEAVAAYLGYTRVQDFNRFFKKRLKQSPSSWGRKERERIRDLHGGLPEK